MDEVLVPQGSWQEAHAKAQRKYNLQLAAGIIILGATIAFVCTYQHKLIFSLNYFYLIILIFRVE